MSMVDQRYWDQGYERLAEVYHPERIEFRELFRVFMKKGGTCFEVGCYPGDYLIYLGREFDCTVSGVDLTPKILELPQRVQANGVRVGKFFREDFRTFRSSEKYDVVLSLGFVEHFENYFELIEKHTELLNPGGILILACPNFRKIQFLLHRILDPMNLSRHNLRAMNLSEWKKALLLKGMTIRFVGYHRTAEFWVDSPRSGRASRFAIRSIIRAMAWIDQHCDWPNPLTSPYMVCIAEKPATKDQPL